MGRKKKVEGVEKTSSFNAEEIAKGVNVPDGVKHVYVTSDGQVFVREDFANKHSSNKKLKVEKVTL